MTSPHSPNQNHLLAALPAAEFHPLTPHLERVPLSAGPRLPPGPQQAAAGIQSRRLDATLVAALHPGADYPDDAGRGLQSAPFDRAETVPLAVADARSIAFERTG